MDTIYSQDESDRLQLLNNVKHHLWLAGMHRSKIRPLHRQVVLERDIVISEDISLHFVTRDGKAIFIKPFPRCLLQAESTDLVESVRNDNITRGFIWTYISMIQTESDLRVALENYLLPSDLLPRELRKSEIKSKRDMEVAFENWVNIMEKNYTRRDA